MYSGRWKRALAVWLGGVLGLFALVAVGLLKTFPGLIVWCGLGLLYPAWAAWDAVRLARAASGYRLRPFNRWYLYLAVGLVAAFLTRPVIRILPCRSYFIPSGGMEPTLLIGDHMIVDQIRWWHQLPARGDLVIFEMPDAPGHTVIKRVLAVGGERIEIRNWVVFVDGQPLKRDWAKPRDPESLPLEESGPRALAANYGPFEVPQGTFFAVGDDRENSNDSRFYGPVPNDRLRGQPLYLYWAKDRSRIGKRLR